MAASSVSSSRLPLSASLAFSDLTEEMLDCGPGGFLRELEELRSENDYLKVRGPGGGRGGRGEARVSAPPAEALAGPLSHSSS